MGHGPGVPSGDRRNCGKLSLYANDTRDEHEVVILDVYRFLGNRVRFFSSDLNINSDPISFIRTR